MLFRACALLLCSISLYALPGYFEPWGKDADLIAKPSKTEAPLRSPLALVMEKVILFHQKVLTNADGPRSHFRPTSSEYMRLAIHRYGAIEGFLRGCDRLLRENNEDWIYPTTEANGSRFKWDPP